MQEKTKTPEQFVEEFCSSSRRIKIKGNPVKWFKKRLDEQYEEEYALPLRNVRKNLRQRAK